MMLDMTNTDSAAQAENEGRVDPLSGSKSESLSSSPIIFPDTKSVVQPDSESPKPLGDCVLWAGSCYGNGYGQVRWKGKRTGTHRAFWQHVHGEIPLGWRLTMCVISGGV